MTTSVSVVEPGVDDAAHVDRMVVLDAKLDALTQSVQDLAEQVHFLTQKAYEDRRRQQEWDDLKADMKPVVEDMYTITVEQLEEIQAYVQLEDVFSLLKRLARNTRTFNELLDQVESMQDLWKDLGPLTKDMFDQSVFMLNDLEQKGYFGFIRQGQYVLDEIVTSFDEEDVRLLGDNVVLILNTVKALTQPEVMTLVNNLTHGFQEVEEHPEELSTSFMGMLGQMRDPDVRRGLAITLAMFKRISQQYPNAAQGQRVLTGAANGNGHR